MEILFELPVIEPEAVERADAARNRERILCTARRLFAERGAGAGMVSMDEVAEAAGVGKGTLFRRFGSRAALVHAVLGEDERALQENFIRGDPPLGPGAPARERLIAFGEARLEMLDKHADLLMAAEVGSARFVSAPYGVQRLHLQLLLAEADPACDPEVLAEMLLSALAPDLFVFLRDVREVSLERIKDGWRELISATIPATVKS